MIFLVFTAKVGTIKETVFTENVEDTLDLDNKRKQEELRVSVSSSCFDVFMCTQMLVYGVSPVLMRFSRFQLILIINVVCIKRSLKIQLLYVSVLLVTSPHLFDCFLCSYMV